MRNLLTALLLALSVVEGAVPAASQEWAKKTLEASTRHGEWADIKVGTRTLSAFVVYPERKDKAPAILVIHEIFGLTDWVRSFADSLAAEGYIAIAPDMLSAFGPDGKKSSEYPDVDAVRGAIRGLDEADVMKGLDAAAEYSKTLPASDGRVSAVGFCWGGGKAFRFAAHRPDLRASFVFYGPSPADVSSIQAPVFGFYAENDARINASLADTEKAMKAAGKRFEPVVYEGGGHGFMRGGQDPEGRKEDAKARKKAWKRLKKLLR